MSGPTNQWRSMSNNEHQKSGLPKIKRQYPKYQSNKEPDGQLGEIAKIEVPDSSTTSPMKANRRNNVTKGKAVVGEEAKIGLNNYNGYGRGNKIHYWVNSDNTIEDVLPDGFPALKEAISKNFPEGIIKGLESDAKYRDSGDETDRMIDGINSLRNNTGDGSKKSSGDDDSRKRNEKLFQNYRGFSEEDGFTVTNDVKFDAKRLKGDLDRDDEDEKIDVLLNELDKIANEEVDLFVYSVDSFGETNFDRTVKIPGAKENGKPPAVVIERDFQNSEKESINLTRPTLKEADSELDELKNPKATSDIGIDRIMGDLRRNYDEIRNIKTNPIFSSLPENYDKSDGFSGDIIRTESEPFVEDEKLKNELDEAIERSFPIIETSGNFHVDLEREKDGNKILPEFDELGDMLKFQSSPEKFLPENQQNYLDFKINENKFGDDDMINFQSPPERVVPEEKDELGDLLNFQSPDRVELDDKEGIDFYVEPSKMNGKRDSKTQRFSHDIDREVSQAYNSLEDDFWKKRRPVNNNDEDEIFLEKLRIEEEIMLNERRMKRLDSEMNMILDRISDLKKEKSVLKRQFFKLKNKLSPSQEEVFLNAIDEINRDIKLKERMSGGISEKIRETGSMVEDLVKELENLERLLRSHSEYFEKLLRESSSDLVKPKRKRIRRPNKSMSVRKKFPLNKKEIQMIKENNGSNSINKSPGKKFHKKYEQIPDKKQELKDDVIFGKKNKHTDISQERILLEEKLDEMCFHVQSLDWSHKNVS